MNEQKIEAFKSLEQNVDRYFKAADGKLTPAHAEACMNSRKGRTQKVSVQGTPQFTPNPFLTCVANQTGGLLGRLSRPSGSFFVAYDTQAPIRKPAGATEAGPSAKGQWQMTAACVFLVDGDKIEVQPDALPSDGASGSAIPTQIDSKNQCFYMAGSERYVRRF